MTDGMNIGGYDPRFDFTVDLEYGHQGEENLIMFFRAVEGGRVEVKADRYRNGRMAVETQQKPAGRDWKDSGINVTEADWWAYRFAPDAFVIISVARLKNFLRYNKDLLQKRTFAANSDNPAKGFVLYPEQVTDLLTNPLYD